MRHGAINPDMLITARESREMAQVALAQKAGIGQARISKAEGGLCTLKDEELRQLASALDYPVEFFFQSGVIYSGGTCTHYRRRKSLSVKRLKRIEADLRIILRCVRHLLSSCELSADKAFFRLEAGPVGDVETPEEAAGIVRHRWGLPLGPVNSVVGAIERAGGIVIPYDFGTPEVDALSQWLPDLPPVFLVSSHIPGDRMRWTLAHEVGHVVLHEMPSENPEDEANRFAGEFLLPAREVRISLRAVTVSCLGQLKYQWKTSMQALAYRAKTLGSISPRQFKSLMIRFGQLGWRRKEPQEIPREEPSLLSSLITRHVKELGYSIEDLAALLRLDVSDFHRLFLPGDDRSSRSLRLLD